MEIGRKSIGDEEFCRLWACLYQEFYNLSSTNRCDATVVYNTIYMICTSDSNLEERLYWKIGDFFYNRSKMHKDQILQSSDYLQEYIKRYKEYSKLVESIHSLGSFLNNCVKGRKLNDFGYLLWERVVIQNMNAMFFENVFEYAGDNRLVILESFERVVPDSSQPLLYYKEKYERVALKKIIAKYKVTNISNLEQFYKGIKTIVDFENSSMMNTFLACSYEEVHNALEECFLSVKYYEIVYNLIEFINAYNVTNINKSSENNLNNGNTSNMFGIPCNDPDQNDMNQVHFVENKQQFHNSQTNFDYEKVSDEHIESLKSLLETDLTVHKALVAIQPLINKKRTSETVKLESYKKAQTSLFRQLLDCFGSLNAGYSLLKKAYALYVNSVIKNSANILNSSINNVVDLFNSLNIFEDKDCYMILLSIFKDYLQRSKPCYMQRICIFTHSLAKDPENLPLQDQKPFSSDLIVLFQSAINLISDMKEFLNMYQEILRDRLLNRSSVIIREIRILRILELSLDDKLYKMIHGIDHFESNFKILNSLYWNIEPQSPNLPLPAELLREMSLRKPEMQLFLKDGRQQTISQLNVPNNELISLKLRINKNGTESRLLTLAHQYSKIQLSINSKLATFNIYQYVVICLLMKESLGINEIVRMVGINESVAIKVVESLVNHNFLSFNSGIYTINCVDIQSGDYSKIDQNTDQVKDICIESYLQTLGAKILKNRRKIEGNGLINEMKMLSKIDVTNQTIESAIKKLIDKGLAEHKEGHLEFVY